MTSEDKKLNAEALRRVCDPARFDFETTAEVEPVQDFIGQERAMRAMRFGLRIGAPGFNVYVAGLSGTGKSTIVRRLLESLSAEQAVPDDLFYVHNFDDADAPKIMSLPAGKGTEFRADMEELVRDLQEQVPKAFEGKEYEEQRRRIAERHQEHKQDLMGQLEAKAREKGFELKSTPMGFRTIPISEGEPLTQEEYEAMDEAARADLDGRMHELEAEVRGVMAEIKEIDQAVKEEIRELNQQVAMNVLGTLMHDLKVRYGDYQEILDHLEDVQKDIVENIEHFRQQEEQQLPIPGLRVRQQEPDFSRYKVNVVVDNQHTEGAPVVFETNPTFTNVVGRIERRAQFGALLTDFTMIRAGSLAKANGGYLVLNVDDMLRHPFVYEALKRAMRDREVRIEDLSERYGLFSTQTVRPQPIPLKAKVILLGHPIWYQLLYAYDEDFPKIFKVKADFDYQTDREDERIRQLAVFLARLVDEEDLLPLDRTAVATFIDRASRLVDDQKKVSLRFSDLTDLVREAVHWAREDEAEVVTAEHVQRAVSEQEYRASLVKERVQELIQRDVLLVSTDGDKVGEINGLAVHMLGDYVFGRPSKISATVSLGRDGVINVERRARMSHSTHDKGVMILSGFLAERFGQDQPMALTATLTFEQSYGEVAGDSASSTELYCLLSALSGVPLRQGIAVTGSVNQKGEVQAIGGVNHKIEGFFEVCEARGLTGDQGVIIPRSNVQHLMLDRRVVDAVRDGEFHVWAVGHVDEGIEILTGVPAGERTEDGWTKDSIGDRVSRRLAELGEKLRDWGREAGPAAEIVAPTGPEAPGPPPPPVPPEPPRQ